ncbi:MAG: T9SS type A sorting domain-containing protein, partial [Candidatus Eisenbacteria bacterium]|nr:T9SS type A sorting domain-containing protein [Candidatus Eisenbacteria bacterium]
GTHYVFYDENYNAILNGYLGSYFNSEIDAVEFGITKASLTALGWDGVSPLRFQVFTAKDGSNTTCTGGGRSSDITDAFVDDDRGCSDGTLNGSILSSDQGGCVYFASIAHGNQSVNQADDIGSHIYDPESNTGIVGGTGFLRTLDSHDLMGVPLNIHPSGSLIIASQWAATAGGASNPQDGPGFLQEIAAFVDADQNSKPGSLIGGVLAEHIMPYFEGPVNAASIAATDALMQDVFGISAQTAAVMHTPERVIRSQTTGLAPLDGHTFEDIEASAYEATYLDEVSHLHWWFYSGESCLPDQGYRHKVHQINGVYNFMINEREDGQKFGNHDGGALRDLRRSLLEKSLYGNDSEIVVVFDDWEALAGKSFDASGGAIIPNNNPNQYHNTLRWLANHPWIVVSNLKDLLNIAKADPTNFVIDHGYRYDLGIQTYEWLKHASEDSYNNWYYNEDGGVTGNEQDFYDLVPVITGPQGDYHARGATPANDGPPLPSGMKHGDLNSPGTLMYESWNALASAPTGSIREAGILGFLCMIYETAWHEENEVDYTDTDCYQNWVLPDLSWDGMNTWALRLQNHIRQAGFYGAAAQWAEDVKNGLVPAAATTQAIDLDFDGEDEYVLSNNRVWLVFERYGARCVLGAAYDPVTQDGQVILGAPLTNPTAPGEEEGVGPSTNRCSSFKEMNNGSYVDAVYNATPTGNGWVFTSGDALISKTITVAPGSYDVVADYNESVSGDLFVRFGFSPNPKDLAHFGHQHLNSNYNAVQNRYTISNIEGGGAMLDLGSANWVPNPADAGYLNRNLALTEEVELAGSGSFTLTLTLVPGDFAVTGIGELPSIGILRGPLPSPSMGASRIDLTLSQPGAIELDILDASGRLRAQRSIQAGAGEHRLQLDARELGLSTSGIYFIRLAAPGVRATRKWILLR